MTVTRIDPRTALLIIDLQNAVRTFPYTDPIDEVVSNSAALAREFRRRGLPVVLTRADSRGARRGRADAPVSLEQMKDRLPANWSALMEELEPADGDLLLVKQHWGAFTGTGLRDHLEEHGVTQVVLAGVATAFGVESTARHASELGYDVTLVTDAMTDMDAQAQQNSIERVFPLLGECGTTRDVIGRLDGH
ncbi:isochorismatase family cysteine hydrolase [Streptomyces sp. NPDC057699]|uniref:isochorismatase family cysteine hydrolase n=1 Tax=Streptomyces sp. NPDC057699 TaxID=3346220 RepID=UPI00368BA761